MQASLGGHRRTQDVNTTLAFTALQAAEVLGQNIRGEVKLNFSVDLFDKTHIEASVLENLPTLRNNVVNTSHRFLESRHDNLCQYTDDATTVNAMNHNFIPVVRTVLTATTGECDIPQYCPVGTDIADCRSQSASSSCPSHTHRSSDGSRMVYLRQRLQR